MNDEISDRLIDRARSGCPRAFERLIEIRYPKLLSLARLLLRDEHDALDATQDASVRILRSLHRLENTQAFVAWSNTILRRCCLRVLDRRARHGKSHVTLDEEGTTPILGATGEMPIDDRLTIGQILQRLGERSAEIIRLRLLLGLSVREAAIRLGVSEGAIKIRLHRARQEALRLV